MWQEPVFSHLVYKLNCLLLSTTTACSLFFAMIKSHIHCLIYYTKQNLSQFYEANIPSCSSMHVSKCRFISLIVISQKCTHGCTRSHAKRRIEHELHLILHKFQLDSSQVDFSLSTHTHSLQIAVELILKYTSDYRKRERERGKVYHEKCAINLTTMCYLDGEQCL